MERQTHILTYNTDILFRKKIVSFDYFDLGGGYNDMFEIISLI